MGVMKLKDAVPNTLEFDPDMGYNFPDIDKTKYLRAGDGTLHTHTFYYKRKWSIPVIWFIVSEATQIYDWWKAKTDLEFYPDLVNAPATKYNVKIVNRTRPLDRFIGPNFESKFQGKIEIEER